MSKRTPPKLALAATHAKPTVAAVEEVGGLIAKTSSMIDRWLTLLESHGTLPEAEMERKRLVIGERHALLDAIVDLGALAMKCDECRHRKLWAETLESTDELGVDDREIIRRYLDTLTPNA